MDRPNDRLDACDEAPRLDLDPLELTGRARTHVVELTDPRCTLHPLAASAFGALRARAATDGIDLVATSSFRDFDRQLSIWNSKFRGERTLLDAAGRPVEAASCAADARVDLILLWSALPGASRHHWGSDLDVIDVAAMPADYRPQLVPEEYAPGGVFERLGAWLPRHMGDFGFYRPYESDLGGVRPEPWHLSFAPVAERALAALTPQVLRDALESSAIEGREEVLARIFALHARYVAMVDPIPTAARLARLAPLSGSTPS